MSGIARQQARALNRLCAPSDSSLMSSSKVPLLLLPSGMECRWSAMSVLSRLRIRLREFTYGTTCVCAECFPGRVHQPMAQLFEAPAPFDRCARAGRKRCKQNFLTLVTCALFKASHRRQMTNFWSALLRNMTTLSATGMKLCQC